MDSIDVLGQQIERLTALSQELLSEAEDDVLTAIVEEAAQEISMPIALVTLVLEEIQFFKAHYGLPPDLAAARGTTRDVSFCQFVVRDGKPFEVVDAERDKRVPQQLVREYGIRSYLGLPVVVDDVVVGSLCVIDTKPREFTAVERQRLSDLAARVNARLALLSERRHLLRSSLVERASGPAFTELRDSLLPMRTGVASGHTAMTALGAYFRLAEHTLSGGSTSPETMRRSLEAATDALSRCESIFYDIEVSIGDVEDSLSALEDVMSSSSATHLSDVAISGRELARHVTTQIGGVYLPDLSHNPVILTPRSLCVALIATCLSSVASHLASQDLAGGIRMSAEAVGTKAALIIESNELPGDKYQAIADELILHTGNDPSVVIEATNSSIQVIFAVNTASVG